METNVLKYEEAVQTFVKIYYLERGLELNAKFYNSIDLLPLDGKYNYIAYLLADENGVSIKVAKYAGTDKVDLIENEEDGYCSLIKATNQEFFCSSSMLRNRELMRVFKDVGLVEQLSSRKSRILRHYDKSIFEIFEHFVKVIFPFFILEEEENMAHGDNNGVRDFWALLEKDPYITAREMSMYTGVSTSTSNNK